MTHSGLSMGPRSYWWPQSPWLCSALSRLGTRLNFRWMSAMSDQRTYLTASICEVSLSKLVWRSPKVVATAFCSLALDSAKLRSRSRASWALRTSYVTRPSGERVARSSVRRRDMGLVCSECRGKSMELIREKFVEAEDLLSLNTKCEDLTTNPPDLT